MTDTAYAFSFKSLEGKPLNLADFAGKPMVIVNTASKCGFTPQYEGLEALWKAKRDQGLVVLGVPSNDFGKQEPGSASEIKSFCQVRFGVDFPLTERCRSPGRTPIRCSNGSARKAAFSPSRTGISTNT